MWLYVVCEEVKTEEVSEPFVSSIISSFPEAERIALARGNAFNPSSASKQGDQMNRELDLKQLDILRMYWMEQIVAEEKAVWLDPVYVESEARI